MARQITKQMAKKIVSKLKATLADGHSTAHDMMVVTHDGKMIASFGIRRGSNKEAGHDHIPADLKVSMGFTKKLAQCPKSRNDWIREMKNHGYLA